MSRHRTSDTFFERVSPHLDEVRAFVCHVIGYAEAVGDLSRGDVAPDEIVDDILPEAYRELAKSPERSDLRDWLVQLALDRIESQIERSSVERAREIHFEDDVPETPPSEEVSTLGDEVLDFYQPDEDLKVEDLLPDLELPSPELELERKELQNCVSAELNRLPETWKRALLLRYIEGVKGPRLAMAIGRNEAEAARVLRYARAHLRKRLVDAGCTFKPHAGSAG